MNREKEIIKNLLRDITLNEIKINNSVYEFFLDNFYKEFFRVIEVNNLCKNKALKELGIILQGEKL